MTKNENLNSGADYKNISKRQVVYIDIDEEITTIFDRIEKSRIKEVFLVVPNRAVILQTAINFKILKKKADELGKTIAIVSHDNNAIKLAAQSGIPVYKNIEREEKKIEEDPNEDVGMAISPITATGNEISDASPRRIARKKLSIADILNIKRSITQRKAPEKNRLPASEKNSRKIQIERDEVLPDTDLRPSRRTIFTLIGASILLLLIIGYIALPGATIFITPKSEVLSSSINVVFADAQKNVTFIKSRDKNGIATYPISKTIAFEGKYSATGKNFKGSNARGEITIINSEERLWPLVEKTRFQTAEGLVFRLVSQVDVPAATADGPGKVNAAVEADPLDAFEKVVGERGNIGPTKFFLPGLRESSREKLYGESQVVFSGGSTDATALVLAEDLVAARQYVLDELNKKVLSEMMSEVDSYNNVNTTKLSLLAGDKALVFGDARVNIPQDIVGREIESFDVSGELPVKGVMYNHSDFLKILSASIKEAQSPDKHLIKIEENSLEYKIFETDSSVAQLKATATIKAVEEYSIDPQSDEGMRLIKKIKERVADLPIDEAQNKIQNLPEVHTVEIKSWPMWAPKMPTMIENIEVKVVSN